MSEARYKILFSGQVLPDFPLETVKANLAQLFKSDAARIEALFGGQEVALKRDLADAEADRYLAALQRAGADVRKVSEKPQLSLVATDDHPEQEAAPTVQSAPVESGDASRMSCPKCGHEQPKAIECSACGIIIEKFLARQAQVQAAPTEESAAAPALSTSPYAPPQAEVGEEMPEFGELKVFSVEGRIGRVRYLGWSMAMMLVAMLAYGVAGGVMAVSPTVGGILMIPVVIATVVVAVQIGVQRLHDIGWSGWLWLVNFIPVVGSVFALLMLLIPGSQQANRYGPPPPPNSGGVIALAWSFLLVPVLGILAAIAIPQYQSYVERAEQAQVYQQSPDE